MGQNLLNLLQQTWPRGLAAQYCLGGISTNLMSQEMNAFAIKLSGMDLLCVLQYFSSPPLPSTYIPRGASWGKLIHGVPLAKRGGGE